MSAPAARLTIRRSRRGRIVITSNSLNEAEHYTGERFSSFPVAAASCAKSRILNRGSDATRSLFTASSIWRCTTASVSLLGAVLAICARARRQSLRLLQEGSRSRRVGR